MTSLAVATAAADGCCEAAAPAPSMKASPSARNQLQAALAAGEANIKPSFCGDTGSAPLDHAHAARAGDYGGTCEPDEQTMLDHPGNPIETLGERSWIGDPPACSVQDPLPSVRAPSMAALRAP